MRGADFLLVTRPKLHACNIMSNKVAKNICAQPSPESRNGASLYAFGGARKYLNLDERRRVLDAMQSLDTEKALFSLTLAWTGARVSEVLALTPACFQLERGIVSIATLKRRRPVVREVPIPDFLADALNVHYHLHQAQADPASAQERLWHWRRETAWRFIKAVMRRSQIVGCSASPRGLRHGFGIGTIQAGVPLNVVQRWLGHARLSTTAIYTDASGPEEYALAQRFWQLSEKRLA